MTERRPAPAGRAARRAARRRANAIPVARAFASAAAPGFASPPAVAFALAAAFAAALALAPAAALAQAGAPAGASRSIDARSVTRAPAGLLDEARALLAADRAADAYALLEPAVDRHAGDPAFDYLLGLAALDAGRPGVAVLALERVLAAEPGHVQARAEIGRAHLALSELPAARRELEAVARTELPPAVRDTVERYLDTVARLDGARRPVLGGFAELAAGWDDNVNFGSSFGEWVLGNGQALVPLPSSRPRSSAFGSVSAGLAYAAPLAGTVDWSASVGASQRINPSVHELDTGSVDLSAGLATTRSAHRLSASLQYQHLRLDGASFRDALGAIAQWQWEAGPRTQLGAWAQAFDLTFAAEPIRDARRHAAGATLAQGFEGPRAATFAATVYGGRERVRADVPQLSFDFAGLRTALSATLAPGWRASGGWSYERRAFDAPEPLFGAVRVDRQHDLRIGLEHELGASLTVGPVLAWTRNASTLAPNDFDRTQAFVFARWRF